MCVPDPSECRHRKVHHYYSQRNHDRIFKKREIQLEAQRESKGRELYCDASGRPVMTVWSVTGRYHPRGMDDPHSGTKEIRSGGGVTAGQEDLTDDGDIECVWQLI